MADKKELTEEEKDKAVQEEARKKSEARTKLIDDVVNQLHTEIDKGNVSFEGLQSLIKEIQERVGKIQVVAAGAKYGPTPVQIEELHSKEFPVLVKPMADGTPVANIDQVAREGDQRESPTESVPKTAGKPEPVVTKK